jgi:hypothetical protein
MDTDAARGFQGLRLGAGGLFFQSKVSLIKDHLPAVAFDWCAY